MPTTVRGSGWGGASTNTSRLLTSYITDIVRVLEPKLKYAQFGKQKDVPKGSDRLVFPQPNQLPVQINISMVTTGGPTGASGTGSVWGAGASIQGGQASDARGYPVSSSVGVAAITEGTNPTSVTWGATAYDSGPAQYGILVAVSDLLVRDSAIEVIQNATIEVKNSLSRMVDTVIQAVVNAGSNGVIYSGGKTARTGLAAGDLITMTDVVKATTWLRSSNAAGVDEFDWGMVGIIHPTVGGDLMSNTQTGGWADFVRYSSVDDLKAGKLGTIRGVRFLETGWQNYYNSTVPVLPTTIFGQNAFGWGYFQAPEALLTTTPDSNNPLNLYSTIGGKVTLGVCRFEDAPGVIRVARIESAFSTN